MAPLWCLPAVANATAFDHPGAAGGVEAAIVCKAIQTGIAPPTINYVTPDPDCDLDYVPNKPREMEVNAIANNSFGFGGHNACLVAKKFK